MSDDFDAVAIDPDNGQRRKCVEKLRQGVAVWNQWRQANPNEKIVLSGIDFNKTFENSAVWKEFAVIDEEDGEGELDPANSTDNTTGQNDLGITENARKKKGVKISEINLENADLELSILRDVRLRRANLKNANLSRAKLNGARLSGSDITGANFERATLEEMRVRGVTYKRSKLAGKCWGVRRAESISGNARFRRDVIDQDYLDALAKDLEYSQPGALTPFQRAGIERGERKAPHILARLAAWPWAYLKCLMSETSLAVALLAALIAAIVGSQSLQALGEFFAPERYQYLAIGGVIGLLLGAYFKSWYGRWTGHILWRALDYGRDWDRVVVIAAILIGFFGSAYHLLSPDHIALYSGADGRAIADDEHWFYPWFVAAMGFATLGIADVARPITGLGQLVMISNVLAGFTTFGLLLAVLGNVFARRA